MLAKALAHQGRGEMAAAGKLYRDILALEPLHFDALQLLGIAQVQANNLEGAAALLERALSVRQDNAGVYNNLAVVLTRLGRLDQALLNLDRAIELKADDAEAHFNRGNVLRRLDRLEEAVAAYDRAVELRPDHAGACANRGIVLMALKRHQAALASLDQALAARPDHAETYSNRGLVLNALKRRDEALASYDRALAIRPDYAQAHSNRGNLLHELGQFDAALASYDRALAVRSDYAMAHYNRANVLKELQRFEEALRGYDRAIAIQPDYAEAFANRGTVLHETGRLREAVQAFDKAIDLQPDHASAHWNKALALLTLGDMEAGFSEYEWRWKNRLGDSYRHRRNFSQPLWTGEQSLQGKTVLIHGEQGLGDTIQFCRYAEQLAGLGARVILEAQAPLAQVLRDLRGVSRWVTKGDPLPEFDLHCPLVSLPLAFRTRVDTVPAAVPYLWPRAERRERWARHLGEGGFRIAICWQGSTGKVDAGRSFPLRLFEGLGRLEGVRLISLQKNSGTEQIGQLPAGMQVETLPADFDEGEAAFLDSAAVLSLVDLVITSDTALTHLAGALGAPTWLPLKFVPDWRWMLSRTDNPWYPHHRLFRQRRMGDWQGVFDQMEQALNEKLTPSRSIEP